MIKKILITGASGFLGSEISTYLNDHKFEIVTLGRSIKSKLQCDLRKEAPQLKSNNLTFVVHAAGKAHSVPGTVEEIQDFYDVNVIGTLNLLKGLENSAIPQSFIFISTVAVYGKERGHLIDENEPLSAKDPYGQSKILAEELIQNWCEKHKVVCTILRLPLIAGPKPPGNLGSMIKGIQKGYYFNIDGGKAKKSIVLAEDVAKIIPIAAEVGGIYNLTDGYHPSFKELSSLLAQQLNKNAPRNIPFVLAKSLALLGDICGESAPINSSKLKKITSHLTFDDSKARNLLKWNPASVLKGFKIK